MVDNNKVTRDDAIKAIDTLKNIFMRIRIMILFHKI